MQIINNKEFRQHPSGLWVSRDGEVFVPKAKGHTEHLTFGCPDKKGYLVVMRNKKAYKVHRLVAECYIQNPDNLYEVNHKDEDKTNNSVENLEYCDRSYNINYGTRNERVAKANTNGKCSKPVAQYTLDGTLIKTWPSAYEVERALGYAQPLICKCCLGKRKTAYKYKWKYVSPN